ncbi:hypothetical protein [uncultured Roseibium sp.]|uniref:hypothetical protein n=1 Tax=uncultured Roseibium sp. TaxID=1936171 RepID=UPI0032176065
MQTKTLFRTALTAAALLTMTSAGFAKDWVEKVSVKQDGIDVKVIEVSADANGYTKIKTPSHRFLLNLYAKATNGERIVAMKLGAFHNVLYFEGSGTSWNKSFAHRDVGSGSKRTVSIGYKPDIPLQKLSWHGSDPKKQCELNLKNQMKKGLSKTDVLSKDWTVKARAYFELDAVAAHKKAAENNKWSLKNTANQRGGMTYDLTVKCNAGLKKAPPRA